MFTEKTPGQIFPGHLFLCKIILIYQECGDSACRNHNEITRQRGQIKPLLGLVSYGPRNSGNIFPQSVCVNLH